MTTAERIYYNRFIEPTKDKNFKLVGTEIEYPIICKYADVSLKRLGNEFLQRMMDREGYIEIFRGSDDVLVRVDKDGNSFSYDYSYGILELSLAPACSITKLNEAHSELFGLANDFYAEHDCIIAGFGNITLSNSRIEYRYDPYYSILQAYLKEYTDDKTLGECFCRMCSIQSHIDVPYSALLKTYNLFNELSFVRRVLMSNSPGSVDGRPVLCTRDHEWDISRIPNSGMYDQRFESLEELTRAVCKEKINLTKRNGEYRMMKAVSLEDYFESGESLPEDIDQFRSFKHVIVNSFNCLEVREDCTQPLDETFVPLAFNLGLALAVDKAIEIMGEFKRECNITATNSELRRRAIYEEFIADDEQLKNYFMKFYEVAFEALAQRGMKEEVFLIPLKERINKLLCPAKALKKRMENGEGALEALGYTWK